MFNFACKDTNNSQTTNYFWEFLYSLKWIFDHVVTRCQARCDTNYFHFLIPCSAAGFIHLLANPTARLSQQNEPS